MRILHIDCGRELRGGQRQALHLIRGLRARGHDICLLARAGSALLEAALADGADARAFNPWELARAAPRFDITHAHDARSHAIAALLASGALVVSRRVAFPVRRSPASMWKYARARHYIAVSEYVAGQLVAAGIKPERISVVYDGVPVADRPHTPGVEFVAPSTADPMKGSDLAASAAARAGIALRFSTHLEKDLAVARAMLYITRMEGLGSGALLAMAHGVPVIASRVGGLPEAVVHGETGLLVENRMSDISNAMLLVAGDPGLVESMGAAAHRRAAEQFSVERMIEGTLRCYEKAARA
jgi:hypothetical protein